MYKLRKAECRVTVENVYCNVPGTQRIGLILGAVGLAIVLPRVWERRAELAVLC